MVKKRGKRKKKEKKPNRSTFKGKPKRDRYIYPEEFEKLLDVSAHDKEAHAFFRAMGASGMRPVEAENLTCRSVDESKNGLWVMTAKRSDDHERFISLDPDTMSILGTFTSKKGGSEAVFYYTGDPLTVRRMQHLFKVWAKKAEIRPELSVYCLRHFHGTTCIELGMAPHEVSERMGHKGLDMVLNYMTLRDGRNREMADALAARMFKKKKGKR